MDETDNSIVFDDEGICNHCIEAANLLPKYRHVSKHKDLIDTLLEKIKNKKGKYDCLIGLSGGIDSSYVALLAKRWNLNPLCLHFDNGWNSDTAVQNIRKIIKHTGFDYETVVINWPEFKSLQRAYLKAGVIDIEALTDHAIFASMMRIARKEKIKIILSGTNYVTEHGMPESWSWNKLDLRNIKAIHKKHGDGKKLINYPSTTTLKWLFMRKFALGLKFLEPLNLIPYSKNSAMKELKEEFEWEYYGGKHYESTFTKFYQAHILPTKFGVDKRKVHLSALVRMGEISRSDALVELSQPIYSEQDLKRDFDFVAKKLDFSSTTLQTILDSEPVSHKKFNSDKSYIDLLIRIAKFFGVSTLK